MDYQFDKPINRRGTLSMKWEVGESELPMWVADMDFETAPEIHEAIRKRAEHGYSATQSFLKNGTTLSGNGGRSATTFI